jgi:hypothetical protein
MRNISIRHILFAGCMLYINSRHHIYNSGFPILPCKSYSSLVSSFVSSFVSSLIPSSFSSPLVSVGVGSGSFGAAGLEINFALVSWASSKAFLKSAATGEGGQWGLD